jgi:hypothetical protein
VLRRLKDTHQAFDDRADALHPLAAQLVAKEVEAFGFIQHDERSSASMLTAVAPPHIDFCGFGDRRQSSETRPQKCSRAHAAEARAFARTNSAKSVNPAAGGGEAPHLSPTLLQLQSHQGRGQPARASIVTAPTKRGRIMPSRSLARRGAATATDPIGAWRTLGHNASVQWESNLKE